MATIEENIRRFEELLGSVQRTGMDKLMNYIKKKTDFYSAPASTRFHLSCEGGLLQHSLNVYDCLAAKRENPIWQNILTGIPEESLIIMALLHDLCKTNFYVEGTKNQKTYDEEKVAKAERWQIKNDNNGSFIWETVPFYKTNEQFPFGHGDKSVYIVNKYITLTDEEAVAIRFHMGAYESQNIWNSLGNAFEKYPLALALHEADMEATHILQVKS